MNFLVTVLWQQKQAEYTQNVDCFHIPTTKNAPVEFLENELRGRITQLLDEIRKNYAHVDIKSVSVVKL